MAFLINVVHKGKKRRPRITRTAGVSSSQSQRGLMGSYVPRSTAGDAALLVEVKKAVRKEKKKAKTEQVRAFMQAEHEYQLWRGDHPFGKPQIMTGQAAYDANRKFDKKFFDDKNPDARLWCWMLVGTKPLPKGTTLSQYRQQKAARTFTA